MSKDLKLMILKALDAGPKSSGQLAEIIGSHQNTVTAKIRNMPEVFRVSETRHGCAVAPLYGVKLECRVTSLQSLSPVTRMIVSWSRSSFAVDSL